MEYSIDEYEVSWKAHQVGDVELSIIKTDESTYVQLYKKRGFSSSFLRLTEKESTDISNALKSTKKHFKAQKGSEKDIHELATAGKHNVMFRTSTKYGFSVIITTRDRYRTDSFSLSRKEALSIQPLLAQAGKMKKFLDESIKF